MMSWSEKLGVKVFQKKGKILDLGCSNEKINGAFGVDYSETECTDLVFDLDNTLPKKFHNKFDLVYSGHVIEHMGNPLNFLKNCRLYAREGGYIQVITDNASYWRFHKKGYPFAEYHAKHIDENLNTECLKTSHKMLFQLGHLENLFKLANIKVVKSEYCKISKIDKALPKIFGSAYVQVIGER